MELLGTHMPHSFLGFSNGPYFVCVPRGLLSSSQPKALSGGSCPSGLSPMLGLFPFVSFVRRFSFWYCWGALRGVRRCSRQLADVNNAVTKPKVAGALNGARLIFTSIITLSLERALPLGSQTRAA